MNRKSVEDIILLLLIISISFWAGYRFAEKEYKGVYDECIDSSIRILFHVQIR
jgi:hypothetical protein